MIAKISKGIPIPPPDNQKVKYPFATMEVGDSFVYKSIRGPQSTYDRNARLAPKKFTCRKEGDNYRIWRVK